MSDGQRYTVETAQEAAERGELEAWVAEFLASPGSDNAELAEILGERQRWWFGPVELPIDQLHRLAGPPGDPVLVAVDDDWWRDDVEDLAERVDQGLEPPPLVVTFRSDQLVLEDGNHRVEALRRTGLDRAWAIVNVEDPADLERAVARVPR